MKAIKNMRELDLMREKLKYKVLFYEKELVGNSADLVENVTDKLKDAAFDFGFRLMWQLISPLKKKKKKRSAEEKDRKKEV